VRSMKSRCCGLSFDRIYLTFPRDGLHLHLNSSPTLPTHTISLWYIKDAGGDVGGSAEKR
jgi:hypothetical protein